MSCMKYIGLILLSFLALNSSAKDNIVFPVFGKLIVLVDDCRINAKSLIGDQPVSVSCGSPFDGPKGYISLRRKLGNEGDISFVDSAPTIELVKYDSSILDGFEHYMLEISSKYGNYHNTQFAIICIV